jgi:4,5-dihydroxyphthalate decarboxylase
MSKLKLNFTAGLYDRMQALYTREVEPEGIDLNFVVNDDPRNIFNRMLGTQEFDVSELSMSDYLARLSVEKEKTPFVAIPIFPSRCFRHGFITVDTRKGILKPKDLEGKRVGLPRYTMTASVWIRGLLQHEYGVDLSTINWVEGAINRTGEHGEPDIVPLVRKVPITANETGKSLSQLIDEGELDAIIGTSLPESRRHNPYIRRLFPDFREIEKAYYGRTGIFPIMHCISIRRSTYEANPWIAKSLYRAFTESKKIALDRMRYVGALRYMLPWMTADLDEIDQLFGQDPWVYGLEENRHTLETFMKYQVDHGIIKEALPIEDLFVSVE